MSNSIFPYGNDPRNLDAWAGKPESTKSSEWLIAYHSGWSFFLGRHNFLFFGRESLVAGIVSFVGGGFFLEKGAIDAMKKQISRGIGASEKPMYEAFEKAQDANNVANDAKESFYDINGIQSAHDIYMALHGLGQLERSTTPFGINELNSAWGSVGGVGVQVGLGAANFYFISAFDIFKNWKAFNISQGSPELAAKGGGMLGKWAVHKAFSLWDEKKDSKEDEHPFRHYDVDPIFKDYRSTAFANEENFNRHEIFERTNGRHRRHYPESLHPGKATADIASWNEQLKANGGKWMETGYNDVLLSVDKDALKILDGKK